LQRGLTDLDDLGVQIQYIADKEGLRNVIPLNATITTRPFNRSIVGMLPAISTWDMTSRRKHRR
jgi:hypothetical protein